MYIATTSDTLINFYFKWLIFQYAAVCWVAILAMAIDVYWGKVLKSVFENRVVVFGLGFI